MVDSGLLTVYSLQNTAAPGRMPVDRLVSALSAYYSDRTIGYNRLYAAMGANQRIDRLVRVWWPDELPDGDLYCIPEDGKQYRITAMQSLVEQGAYDLTLERLGTNYEIAE